ncbi:hypothetical protein ACFOWX_03625 [Sphingorhabdus arenilitoris]|uniref:Phage gp6-like head-tail connector protein n=1 Tax=Sphingorhabdus arenilitoris TaxID=1490041 RepID=A0ABV8RFN7_9SPHN
MLSIDPLNLDSFMLDEVRAYLRLDQDAEDTSLGAILLAAIVHAESFTRQIMIRRTVREIMPSSSHWQRLSASPVAAVVAVAGIPAEGSHFAMDESHYTARIDADGDAYISVRRAGSAGRIEVTYQAGLAASWSDLPESLRLAILRMTGHLHLYRDNDGDAGPPAAVAALLRPWRRMRLSA